VVALKRGRAGGTMQDSREENEGTTQLSESSEGWLLPTVR